LRVLKHTSKFESRNPSIDAGRVKFESTSSTNNGAICGFDLRDAPPAHPGSHRNAAKAEQAKDVTVIVSPNVGLAVCKGQHGFPYALDLRRVQRIPSCK